MMKSVKAMGQQHFHSELVLKLLVKLQSTGGQHDDD